MNSKPEDARKGFLQQILPASGKAKRLEPTGKKPKPDKKSMTVWLEPVVIQQFKVLAAERDVEIQELMAEAMNMVFAKYGKPQIA